MLQKIKENWFVALVAVLLVGAVGFYALDTNTGKLPGKTENGKDVVATIGDMTIYADDIYADLYGNIESGKSAGTQILYMYFERAVVDAAVEDTTEIKLLINNQVAAVKQNYQAYYGDNWETQLLGGLQAAGYSSLEDLETYFAHYVKLEKLLTDAYNAELEELFAPIHAEKKSRTVSHILIKMADPKNPTADEQAKMDAVDKALADGTPFAEVAKSFSDDGSAAQGGSLGYADANTSFVTEFLDAMLKLEKGEVSEWVETVYGRHLIVADETDMDALLADETLRPSIYTAISSYYPTFTPELIWETAEGLNISFSDAKIETALKEYLGIEG